MGKKSKNSVRNLELERDSSSTTPITEQTSGNEKERIGRFEKDQIEYDLGLDISSSITGVVLLDSKGNLAKMDFIKLNSSKLTTIFKKADYAKEWLINNLNNVKIRHIFVEANAKMFAKGLSSADTLFTLAKMNALISYLVYKQFNAKIIDVNVTSARSKIGFKNSLKDKRPVKEKTREFVLKNFPEIPVKKHIAKTGKNKGNLVMDSEMADCIDAFVICRGGQLLISS